MVLGGRLLAEDIVRHGEESLHIAFQSLQSEGLALYLNHVLVEAAKLAERQRIQNKPTLCVIVKAKGMNASMRNNLKPRLFIFMASAPILPVIKAALAAFVSCLILLVFSVHCS